MRITDLLGGQRPTVSFEFFPPKTEQGRQALIKVVERLAPIAPDYVSVTYGAGGSTRALTLETCLSLGSHLSGEVMAHLTCVCHTRDEVASIADELWNAGVANIMALRGDRPKDRVSEEVFSEFRFGKDLISYLKTRHNFCLGGGCYPEGHTETPDIDAGIEHLKQKIDAGCDFLVTQMFFGNEHFFRFRYRLRKAGVTTPVIPGIMPISGVAQLDKFENQFGVSLPAQLHARVESSVDHEQEIESIGVAWAVEQCRELLEEGVPGIHFYTLNRSIATVQVCKDLNLVGSAAG